jgi:hypothetical protein
MPAAATAASAGHTLTLPPQPPGHFALPLGKTQQHLAATSALSSVPAVEMCTFPATIACALKPAGQYSTREKIAYKGCHQVLRPVQQSAGRCSASTVLPHQPHAPQLTAPKYEAPAQALPEIKTAPPQNTMSPAIAACDAWSCHPAPALLRQYLRYHACRLGPRNRSPGSIAHTQGPTLLLALDAGPFGQ